MEGPTAVTCEKGGPMADYPHASVRNQAQAHLRASKRLLSADDANVIAERRRVSNDAIRRLEDIVALQEERLKSTRHQSGESLSHIRQLHTAIADVLLISKHTLETLRQSAETLELAWATLA